MKPWDSLACLRWAGFLEGISYLLLLFVAMPMKYLAGDPRMVRVVGMIHGLLFIAFVLALLWVKLQRDWSDRKAFLGFAASLIPFAIFYADRALFREKSAASFSAPPQPPR
jgi:integral membrane protein